VSFFLDLEVEGLTQEQAQAVEAACGERGAWPVARPPLHRRRFTFFGRGTGGPSLEMPADLDSDRQLLSDAAEWDAPAWAMEPSLLPMLAESVRILGERLPQGFALRATWVGSKVRQERVLSSDELAELILASQLNEFTRYRVPGRT
jgi:hypothetical protein